MTVRGTTWRDIDVLSNMIVTTKPCGFACHDTSETRPFGKRKAPRALITSLQIPFVMLRFILRKGAWLTPRSSDACRRTRDDERVLKFVCVEIVADFRGGGHAGAAQAFSRRDD